MLDTVKLQISLNDVKVSELYFPEASTIDRKIGYNKVIRNPTASEKKMGIYMPRITLVKRGYKKELYIEFSVQKIMFNESVNEVDESMFGQIIKKLKDKLQVIGIMVSEDILRKAKLVTMHPAKNVQLESGYTASYVISELAKVNIDERKDLTRYRFTEGKGSSLQFYTKEHSLVIYDKLADLVASKSKSNDKDRIRNQRNIFDEIKNNNKYFEVLRFEVRLCSKKMIKSVLEKVGHIGELNFESLFNSSLCQGIIYYYWGQYFLGNNLFLFDIEDTPQKLLIKLKRELHDKNLSRIIYLIGLQQLCIDTGGIMGLRGLISFNEWCTIKKAIKLLNGSTKETYPFLDLINDSLIQFNQFTYKKTINDKKLSTLEDLECKEK